MRKIGLLTMALVLALGTLGVGYAVWTEDMEAEITLDTATVTATIEAGDSWTAPACTYTSIKCEVDEHGVLQVTVTNAYPCIDYFQEFSINNEGSIPWKISAITYEDVPSGMTVEIEDLAVGDQVNPGASKTGTLKVHLDDTIDQDETFEFSVTISVVQWR